MNWQATLAAITARGPRCDTCGAWTFRPYLTAAPTEHRRCPRCVPSPTDAADLGHRPVRRGPHRAQS